MEAIIVIMGLGISIRNKQTYGWGISLTFGIYVFYDLARNLNWEISSTVMTVSFLVATISALVAVYFLFKKSSSPDSQ